MRGKTLLWLGSISFSLGISAILAQDVLAMELAPISYVPPELIHLLHVSSMKAQTRLQKAYAFSCG